MKPVRGYLGYGSYDEVGYDVFYGGCEVGKVGDEVGAVAVKE